MPDTEWSKYKVFILFALKVLQWTFDSGNKFDFVVDYEIKFMATNGDITIYYGIV